MKECAILVNSCDAYSDLWDVFFKLLKKNWEGIEKYNIYLNTETIKEYKNDLQINIINTIQDGEDLWGKRVRNSLRQIKEKYVIVLMDDFFLKSKIDVDSINNCIRYMESDSNIATFYLNHIKRHSYSESKYNGFCEIPKKKNYRLNSAPGIWRKEKLYKYIKETDNPWAWEYFGTCRTNVTKDTFYAMIAGRKPIYDYAHAIYRGKWLEQDIKPLLQKYDFNIDTSIRGIVKEGSSLPKRSIKWKIKFVITGIKMVGIDALKEIIRDKKDAK